MWATRETAQRYACAKAQPRAGEWPASRGARQPCACERLTVRVATLCVATLCVVALCARSKRRQTATPSSAAANAPERESSAPAALVAVGEVVRAAARRQRPGDGARMQRRASVAAE